MSALLARQAKSGGWGWAKGVAPDSNDTAAAVQALRAAGVTGAPIRRALDYLRKTRNRDGGFAIVSGRESDAQSTAWAIQAFVAAGAPVPKGAFTYLRRLRQGRRQLPLLCALRGDAGLGDRPGGFRPS